MKCPKCKSGNDREYWKYACENDEKYPSVYVTQDCPHCRRTGEIQEGDFWLCEITKSGYQSQSPKIFVLQYINNTWQSLDTDFVAMSCFNPRDNIEPICRMEEIK